MAFFVNKELRLRIRQFKEILEYLVDSLDILLIEYEPFFFKVLLVPGGYGEPPFLYEFSSLCFFYDNTNK